MKCLSYLAAYVLLLWVGPYLASSDAIEQMYAGTERTESRLNAYYAERGWERVPSGGPMCWEVELEPGQNPRAKVLLGCLADGRVFRDQFNDLLRAECAAWSDLACI